MSFPVTSPGKEIDYMFILTKANPSIPSGFDARSALGQLQLDTLVEMAANGYGIDKEQLYSHYEWLPTSIELVLNALVKGFSSFLAIGSVKRVTIYYPHVVCYPRFNSLHSTYYYLVEYGNGAAEFSYFGEVSNGLETAEVIDKYILDGFSKVLYSISIDTDIYHYAYDYPRAADKTTICVNHINKLFIKENFGHAFSFEHGKSTLVSAGMIEGATSVFKTTINLLRKATVTADIDSHTAFFAIDSDSWNLKGEVDYDEYRKIAFEFMPKFMATRYLLSRLIRLLNKKPKAFREAEISWIKNTLALIKKKYSLQFDQTIESVLQTKGTMNTFELSKNIGAFSGAFFKAALLED